MRQVLQAISQGETHSFGELARRLELSETLLAHVLADLVRKGYLVSTSPEDAAALTCCDAASKSCGGCLARPAVAHTWTLTEKGRRLASSAL